MLYQLKPAFETIQKIPGISVPWVEVQTRQEAKQRTDTADIPFLERSLVHSHNCKAELLELSLIHIYTIYETSTACGFEDYFYFLKVFKSKTGMTPSEYRNS